MSLRLANSPGISSEHRTYMATETAISVVINGTISVLFAWLVFGDRTGVELWGARGLAVDFIPQSVMIALMSTLVPTLLTRSRLRQGKIASLPPNNQLLPANLLLRALTMAVIALAVGSGLAIAVLSALMFEPLPILTVYAVKAGYGCLVAFAVTPVAIHRALSDPREGNRT